MFPDLIKTRNQKVHSSFAIKKVTNVRTIYTLLNEVEAGKTMLSEVNHLLQIFLIIQHLLQKGHFPHSGILKPFFSQL